MRLCRRCLLARDIRLRYRTFLNRPYWLASNSIEDIKPTDFVRQCDCFHRAAIDHDVGQNGSRRIVEIPNRIMDQFGMPLPLACLQVDGDETLAEQIVSRPVSAIVIGRGCFHRGVNQSELFIDCDLGPDSSVTVRRPRTVFPSLTSKFARGG